MVGWLRKVLSRAMGSSNSNPTRASDDSLILEENSLTKAIENQFAPNLAVTKVQKNEPNDTVIILAYREADSRVVFDDSFMKKIFATVTIDPDWKSHDSHRSLTIHYPEVSQVSSTTLKENALTKAIESQFTPNLAAIEVQKPNSDDTEIFLAHTEQNPTVGFGDSFTEKIFATINPHWGSHDSHRIITIQCPEGSSVSSIVLKENALTKAIESQFTPNLAAIKVQKNDLNDTEIILAYTEANSPVMFDDSFVKRIFATINPHWPKSESYRKLTIHYPV